jgi:hypothetical protein
VWALKQFKGTKSSQYPTENDALEYFLLINDNTVADRHKQPKEFAKGDYLISE